MKDELAGEVPVAFIIRTEGSQISEDEIKQFVAREVIPNLTFEKKANTIVTCPCMCTNRAYLKYSSAKAASCTVKMRFISSCAYVT